MASRENVDCCPVEEETLTWKWLGDEGEEEEDAEVARLEETAGEICREDQGAAGREGLEDEDAKVEGSEVAQPEETAADMCSEGGRAFGREGLEEDAEVDRCKVVQSEETDFGICSDDEKGREVEPDETACAMSRWRRLPQENETTEVEAPRVAGREGIVSDVGGDEIQRVLEALQGRWTCKMGNTYEIGHAGAEDSRNLICWRTAHNGYSDKFFCFWEPLNKVVFWTRPGRRSRPSAYLHPRLFLKDPGRALWYRAADVHHEVSALETTPVFEWRKLASTPETQESATWCQPSDAAGVSPAESPPLHPGATRQPRHPRHESKSRDHQQWRAQDVCFKHDPAAGNYCPVFLCKRHHFDTWNLREKQSFDAAWEEFKAGSFYKPPDWGARTWSSQSWSTTDKQFRSNRPFQDGRDMDASAYRQDPCKALPTKWGYEEKKDMDDRSVLRFIDRTVEKRCQRSGAESSLGGRCTIDELPPLTCRNAVVISVVSVGRAYSRDVLYDERHFTWKSLRIVSDYYRAQGVKVHAVVTTRTATRSPIPEDLTDEVVVTPAPLADRGGAADLLMLRLAEALDCPFLDNGTQYNFDLLLPEVRAFLHAGGATRRLEFQFHSDGTFTPLGSLALGTGVGGG